MKKFISTIALAVLIFPSVSLAAPKIKLKVPISLKDSTLLAVADSGATESVQVTSRSVKITPPASRVRLYLVQSGQVSKAVVVPVCKKASCKTASGKTKVLNSIRAGANLTVKSVGQLLVAASSASNYKKIAKGTSLKASTITSSIKSLGLASAGSSAIRVAATEAAPDADSDGLINQLDADDDNDGVLDNYDSTNVTPSDSKTFKVFSNLKLEIESSLNLHSTGLEASRIDTALQNVQTLAIEVSGSESDSVELDCGTLGYCSAGGTGSSNGPFPGTSGGTNDLDGDGKGTITRGGTGDFQLSTGATSSQIGAGDTLIQIINEGADSESQIPGMLNFVFNSTPAIKSIAVNEGTATELDYSASPIAGQRNNCITVPSTGDVSLTITGWRPQRPGISDAGESAYMDIGNSLITIDIPNGACSGQDGQGCAPQGPGNCAASSYSTSDSNLSVGSDGLRDNSADAAANSSNTYNFTINLTGCLSNAPSGPVSWGNNETIFVDLQFRSPDGDNAAQKFCVLRSDG